MALTRRPPHPPRPDAALLATEASCVVGEDGRLVRVSPALGSLLGRDTATLYREHFRELTHPDDRGAVAAALSWAGGDGVPVSFECRWRHGDGRWRWLEWRAARQPEQPQLVAVARDISRWKLEEEAALAQARVLEAIAAERGRDEIVQQLCALVETVGSDVRGGVYAADPATGALRLVASSARVSAIAELPPSTPLAGPLPAGLWLEVALDANDTPVGAVGALLAVPRSPTAAERQVLQLAAQLLALASGRERREGERRRLERALEFSSDLVVIFAATGGREVRYVNDAFVRRTGYRAADVVGQPFPELAGPESEPETFDRLAEAIATGRPAREELVAYTVQGAPFWVDLALAPVCDEAGTVAEWICSMRDVSERKEREAAAAAQWERPALALQAESLGHRRTPPPPTAPWPDDPSGAEAATEPTDADAIDVVFSAAAHTPAETAAEIPVAAAPAPPIPAPLTATLEGVDLSALIDGLRHLLAAAVPAGTHLHFRLGERLPPVTGDADLLRQMVLALVHHAAHDLAEGGTISLATGVVQAAHAFLAGMTFGEQLPAGLYVTLEASDTGSGEGPATLFPAPGSNGRGTSDATLLGIVKAHRGAIRVFRKARVGSTVQVVLPAGGTAEGR